jgi:hypothetical protein
MNGIGHPVDDWKFQEPPIQLMTGWYILVIQYQYVDRLILTSNGFLSLGWNPDLSQDVRMQLPALLNAYPVTLPICFLYSGHEEFTQISNTNLFW